MKKYRLNEIVVYPIKGAGGISVRDSQVEQKGLKYDRRWMLVDGRNRFISQRGCPKMSLINASFTHSGLEISYGNTGIKIPYEEKSRERVVVDIWGSAVECGLMGVEWDRYFSELLSMDARLVCMDPLSSRVKEFKIPPFTTSVSLADGYPVLVLGTESVSLLNTKLEEPVLANRFRANLLINTDIAHEEDDWKRFRIGKVVFQMIKPCTRCQVVTIDQSTANISVEPLRTLAGYRKEGNNINFAMNAIVLKEGLINTEDELEILE